MTNKYLVIQSAAIAFLCVFASFMWQGNVGFSLWDEGFLWYGVQQVMHGEQLPIRDFMAYDPARYYWSAGLMTLFGSKGILAVRATVAVFQMLGLFVGLILISRSLVTRTYKHDFLYLLLSALTLIVWMFPRHKLFDISISLFLLGMLTFLIESPTNRRFFIVGIGVGVAAIFGRNHGVYGVIGSLGVMAWLQIGQVRKVGFLSGFLNWSAGVIIGYTPMLIMIAVVPEFFDAFVESIRYLFQVGASSISIPVPWPWTVDFAGQQLGWAVRNVIIGLFFIGVILFGVTSLLWAIKKQVGGKSAIPALIACSLLSLPYAHYAYSRAEVGHLAHGVFPLLIGSLILINTIKANSIRWVLAVVLCASSVWVMFVFHPGTQCALYRQCVNAEVSNDHLKVDENTASEVRFVEKVAAKYAPNGEAFLVVPFWPGAYPLLEGKSPIWEIYSLTARSREFQEAEIKKIVDAKPKFILMSDVALDGLEDRSYKSTHPLIYAYIIKHYHLVPAITQSGYKLYLPGMDAL